jgi:S1-C subfamily serine protease
MLKVAIFIRAHLEIRSGIPIQEDSALAAQAQGDTNIFPILPEAAMNPRSRGLVVLILVLALAGALSLYVAQNPFASATPRLVDPRGELSAAELSTIEVFQRVSPSVVQIVARAAATNQFEEDEGQSRGASGTGFVWDQSGHVVTNDHVVQGARAVGVRLASGDVVQGDVVGLAPNYDLAVVRMRNPRQVPPPVPLGSSAELKVGQTAYAIGNPFGLDQSLTSGIVSALKRRLPTNAGREIANVIQTDAAVNPGNSGGPLLDSAGRLIGVTTAIISPSGSNAGIGFAVPADTVNRIVPELIRSGRVPTPGIGIVAASEAVATRMGIEGVIVVRTAPGSPAARAGLRGVDLTNGSLGDVIVEVNGKPVRRLSDLSDELEQIGVGKSVRLAVRRGGETRTVEVQINDISQT